MTLKTAAAIYKAIATELGLRVSNNERESRNAIEEALTKSRQPMWVVADPGKAFVVATSLWEVFGETGS